MAAVDDLLALEPGLDALALGNRLAMLPRRSVLTGLLCQAHLVMHGWIGPDQGASPSKGRAMINRYSYLLHILDQCPEEPIGASAANARLPFDEDPTLLDDQMYLVQYGHLCEMLPEIRREWYDVTGSEEAGFRLDHPTLEFSSAEARDTVLADVTQPMVFQPPPNDSLFDDACLEDGLRDDVIVELQRYVKHFKSAVFEIPMFPDAAWQETFGLTEDSFVSFQAFWLALSETWLRMGAALQRRFATEPANEALGEEWLEWVVPYLDPKFVGGLAIATAGVDGDAYDTLVDLYSHKAGGQIGGDGFLPPLHPLGNGVLFSPAATQMMLGSRNVAYGLNKSDPVRFADVLSSHLEPFLLSKAVAIVQRIPGVEVRTNVHWEKGEIDLVVYDSSSNHALHVQAKAPVPPQGARMTKAVESRSIEGLKQLAGLRAQPTDQINQILSSTFGHTVEDAHLLDMLLVRSCLGTHRVWSMLGDVVPTNLHVLAAAVDRVITDGLTLADLPAMATKVLDDIVADVVEGWEHGTADFALVSIQMPLLSINEARLSTWRLKLHNLVG